MARKGRLSGSATGTLLNELGEEVSEEAKKALLAGGHTILSEAKTKIRDISGALAASGIIETNKKGTIVKIIFDAASPATANSEGGYVYSKIVEFMPGHEHPYLYPTYDANRNQIKENVIEAMRKAVHRNAVP